jgi:transcriptional regulator
MYLPKHFEENNAAVLYEFIRCNPFAVLVTNGADGLSADHIPILLNTDNEERICLQGHIAASNSLWKTLVNPHDTLVIFQGSNSYITPGWYPTKKIDGRVVPTWNYTAVHVKGEIEFIHEPGWKMTLLNNLTLSHEEKFSQPWSVSDAPPEFIEKLLPAIVGFEIIIKEIFGKFKLSQNQPLENRVGIAQSLEEQGHEMAGKIQRT